MDPPLCPAPDPEVIDHLPRPLTSFVGRDRDRANLASMLTKPTVRLLTLTGPGGIGKTRLAFEIVASLWPAIHDGIVIVPLAPITDPGQVSAAIAHALRLAPQPDRTASDAVIQAINSQDLLLILDNLEHLLSAGLFLADLIRRCPALTILATSRTRLGISGEHVYTLDPLTPGDARALFLQRATTLGLNRPIPEDAATIDVLCTKLDHLPLAIELAAARMATLSPQAILERLSAPLTLLRHGPRDVPLRQQTMRDTIAWSYDLLDERQQEGFRHLAVFAGGFTLDAAQAVLGVEQDALDLVEFLVAHSLVVPMASEAGHPRFTMLESIRQFGLEALAASGDEEAVRIAHADFLIDLAERTVAYFDPPREAIYARTIRDELENVRAALAWTVDRKDGLRANRLTGSVWYFWELGTFFWLTERSWQDQREEWCRWQEAALALRDGIPPRYTLESLSGMIVFLAALERPDEMERYAQELLDNAIALGKINNQRTGHLGLAMAARMRNQWDVAREHYARALALAPHTGHSEDYERVFILSEVGYMEFQAGEWDRMEAAYLLCLEHGLRTGDPARICGPEAFLAVVYHKKSQHRETALHGLNALDAFFRAGEFARARGTALILAELALSTNHAGDGVRLLAFASTTPRISASEKIDDARIAPFRAPLPPSAFTRAWDEGIQLPPAGVLQIAARIAAANGVAVDTAIPDDPKTSRGQAIISERERDVLGLLVTGATNLAIAQALFISERTVEKHLSRILARLGLETRTALVAWAIHNGIEGPPASRALRAGT